MKTQLLSSWYKTAVVVADNIVDVNTKALMQRDVVMLNYQSSASRYMLLRTWLSQSSAVTECTM